MNPLKTRGTLTRLVTAFAILWGGDAPVSAAWRVKPNRDPNQLFEKINDLLTAKCSDCHYDFPRMSEQELVTAGYFVPLAPERSLLFRKMRGANVGGPENMPPAASQSLTAAEIEMVRTWINGTSIELIIGGAEARKTAALAVLKSHCASCHSSEIEASSSQFAGAMIPAFGLFEQENEFVSSGLIFPGESKSSLLLRSLREYGDLNLMPPGSPLPKTEFPALQIWVDYLGEP